MKSPVAISLSDYFGFDPNSPYADLFSNVYHLTKPRTNVDEEEDGDFEVEDVTISGIDYVATNTQNGTIYKLDSDGEILEDDDGEFVKAGYYKNGVAFIL